MHSEKKMTYIILGALVLFLMLLHYAVIKDYRSLPSPLYGGDYYYQLGATNHVKYGGNSLASPNVKYALPVYFVSYSFITGNIARLLSLDGILTEFLFSYLIFALSATITFMLLKTLFKNDYVAVIGALLYLSASQMPAVKYTVFAFLVAIPLLFWITYLFLKDTSIKNAIILGLTYGFIGLTHSVAFVSASIFLGLTFMYYVLFKNTDFKARKINFQKITSSMLPYIIIFVVGVSIALLWWFKPIFIYHGQTSPHYLEWNGNPDWSMLSNQFSFAVDAVKTYILNFSSWKSSITTLLMLFGLFTLFFLKKRAGEKQNELSPINYLGFLVVAALIATFQFFVLQNLFGINFIPVYIAYFLLGNAFVLISAFGVLMLSHFIKNTRLKLGFFLFIILVLLLFQFLDLRSVNEGRWQQAASQDLPPQMKAMSKYIVENTNVDDVILSTKEVSFALNALTGRKVMISRRAHNDPFLNMDPRELDTALILYGNDTNARKELLKKYEIKYVYWDYYWVQSEYSFDDKGQLAGWFDPMLMFYSEERENILNRSGVNYFVETTWVDPAMRTDNYKKFKLMFISPQNYRSMTQPWNPDLNNYLMEVSNYSQNGMAIARLYRVINT